MWAIAQVSAESQRNAVTRCVGMVAECLNQDVSLACLTCYTHSACCPKARSRPTPCKAPKGPQSPGLGAGADLPSHWRLACVGPILLLHMSAHDKPTLPELGVVVKLSNQALHVLQHKVLLLTDLVRGHSPLALAHAHRAARGVETQPNLPALTLQLSAVADLQPIRTLAARWPAPTSLH